MNSAGSKSGKPSPLIAPNPIPHVASSMTSDSNVTPSKDSTPYDELKRQALEVYRAKDYAQAELLFTQLLARIPKTKSSHAGDRFVILDARAATRIGLGHFQAAFRDAKHMIELYPEEARGYLRASKICMRLEKHGKALHILQVALQKKCKDSTRIEEAIRAIRWEMSRPQRRDPILTLPTEILYEIFERVDFRTRVVSTGVSHRWRNFLLGARTLWREMDFSSRKRAPGVFDATAAHKWVSRAPPTLEALNLGAISKLARKGKRGIETWGGRWPHLRKFALKNNRDVEAALLQRFLQGALQLEELDLAGSCVNDSVVHAALSSCLRLRVFNLADTKITAAGFVPAKMAGTLQEPAEPTGPSSVGASEEASMSAGIDPSSNHPPHPNLNSLYLDRCPFVDNLLLNRVSGHAGLRVLSLRECNAFTMAGLVCVVERLTNLEELYFSGLHLNTPSADLTNTDWCLPRLRVLEISDWTRLADEEVFHMVQGSRWLEVLRLPGCSSLTSSSIWSQNTSGPTIATLKRLRELNLMGCSRVSSLSLCKFLEHAGEQLEVLVCGGNLNVESEVLAAAAKGCPRLVELDVSHTAVTSVGLKWLLQPKDAAGAPMLKRLNLNGCTSVSPEAVQWAREEIFKRTRGTVSCLFEEDKRRRRRLPAY
ncbi:uncharacterized protein VTP21DRAFT_2860 [Calcarisporiella thermophila]|uniref:uncharacterized protein n=1 Tax=Calcarisporiella thermophila TaxID=911321 RepID=UPI003743B44D